MTSANVGPMMSMVPIPAPSRAGLVWPAILLAFAIAAQAMAGGLGAQTPTIESNPGAPPGARGDPSNPDAAEGMLEARLLEGEIRVDGVLDEPAWSTAAVAADFRQQEPDEGRPATFPTWVRIAYSRERLYIGARMEDPEPERILARVLERDLLIERGFLSIGSGDDAFFVVLDTYDDDRNGFLFVTNPNGAETDALVRGEGGDVNVSWDAVWSVAAKVDSGGWSAEIEIPFWSLRFREGAAQRWGVNFQRVIKRRNETDVWRSWTRDNGGLLKVSQAGSLVGLAELQQGLNLQLKPFALAAGRRAAESADASLSGGDTEGTLDAGLDVKFGVTPNLTLDGTVNTDFAQVEADVRQINLTRFSLFFPEKREFFLEGAGIFDFGIPSFGGPPSALLFFSRRIGIESGQEVPILAGTKLTGKEGRYTVGFLDVLTDEEDLLEGEVAPRTNFAAARVIRDVGARSSVGAIATHRASEGESGSGAYGVDTHVQISQKMAFDAFAAATDAPEARGETAAYRAALDFTADQWGWFAEHAFIGAGFEPPVGFVLRHDVNRQFATFRVTPRPPIRGLRRTDIRLGSTIVSSGDWEIRDRNWSLSVSPQLDSGDGAELAVGREFSRLTEAFELSEEVVFPVGDYTGHTFNAYVYTSRNRALSGEVFAGSAIFFSGRNRFVGGSLLVVASRKLSFEASWNHNDIATPHGDLVTDLANVRVNFAFSTHLFTNALLQYDSVTDQIQANVRLNLIHSPGSDLFIVLNEQRGEEGDLLEARNRALVVKFTKLFNL